MRLVQYIVIGFVSFLDCHTGAYSCKHMCDHVVHSYQSPPRAKGVELDLNHGKRENPLCPDMLFIYGLFIICAKNRKNEKQGAHKILPYLSLQGALAIILHFYEKKVTFIIYLI